LIDSSTYTNSLWCLHLSTYMIAFYHRRLHPLN
jgi:hypothetical protein